MSFGEHRARATAEGLVRHAGPAGGAAAADAARLSMIDAGVNSSRPAWNRS
jgi:hypothetical protein